MIAGPLIYLHDDRIHLFDTEAVKQKESNEEDFDRLYNEISNVYGKS